MKKTIVIFLLLLSAFALSAAAQQQTKTFRGAIGSAKFQMTLTRDGKKISGNYFYEKSGTANRLNLSGEIEPDGNFTLREFDAAGKQTGIFKAIWKDDETTTGVQLEGTWTKAAGAEQNFYAFEENIRLTGGQTLTTRKMAENNKPKLFEINVEYPELTGTANAAKFNALARSRVMKSAAEFRKDMLAQTAEDLSYTRKLGVSNYLEAGYQTVYAADDFLSVEFSESTFTGGAHPNHFSYTLNYDLKNGRELKLADLFKPQSDYLKTISDYAIADLRKQLTDMSDDEWLKTGAGADEKNFASWNVNEKGLILNFDPYQVAAYAAGAQMVVVPFEKLKGVLRENLGYEFLKNKGSAQNPVREKFNPARNAGADLTDAIRRAQKTGKRIILDVGGEWCIWCVNMDKFFAVNPDLAKLRDENFVWVKINFSEENKNEEFLAAYPKIPGYPHLFVLDENGKLLHSQNTAELEAGKSYNLAVYTDFLKKWSPVRTADAPND